MVRRDGLNIFSGVVKVTINLTFISRNDYCASLLVCLRRRYLLMPTFVWDTTLLAFDSARHSPTSDNRWVVFLMINRNFSSRFDHFPSTFSYVLIFSDCWYVLRRSARIRILTLKVDLDGGCRNECMILLDLLLGHILLHTWREHVPVLVLLDRSAEVVCISPYLTRLILLQVLVELLRWFDHELGVVVVCVRDFALDSRLRVEDSRWCGRLAENHALAAVKIKWGSKLDSLCCWSHLLLCICDSSHLRTCWLGVALRSEGVDFIYLLPWL